jgi:hypothetical protein
MESSEFRMAEGFILEEKYEAGAKAHDCSTLFNELNFIRDNYPDDEKAILEAMGTVHASKSLLFKDLSPLNVHAVFDNERFPACFSPTLI